jgi:hypothetical protein
MLTSVKDGKASSHLIGPFCLELTGKEEMQLCQIRQVNLCVNVCILEIILVISTWRKQGMEMDMQGHG